MLKEIKYSLRPELVSKNCSWGSRSVNVQFDINLPLLFLKGDGKICLNTVSLRHKNGSLKFHSVTSIWRVDRRVSANLIYR